MLTLAVLLVLVSGAYVGLVFLGEPGPSAPAVLLRRYGAGLVVVAPIVVAAVVVLLILAPIVVVAAGAVVAVVAAVAGWGPGTWRRAVRRGVLRARWTSVARASELAVDRDHRRVGVGADAATLTNVVRLEWTPRIWRGRALPGGAGVSYLLEPARGSSIPEVAKQVERLAAGLHVAAVEIEQVRPDRARLTVRW